MQGSSPKAFAWVQLRLIGGWRIVIAASLAYTVILGGLIILTSRDRGALDPSTLRNWASGLAVLQGLNLLGLGLVLVGKAFRDDFKSHMMESHQLMPVAGWHAVLGYVCGAAILPLALGACTLLLAVMAAAAAGGGSIFNIVVVHGALLCSALLFWMVAATGSKLARFALGFLVFFSFILMQASLWSYVPAIFLLVGPLFTSTFFSSGVGPGGTMEMYTGIALAAQLAFALVLFRAAARRYSHPSAPAYNLRLGIVLLVLWVAASVFAVQWIADLASPMSWRYGGTSFHAMIVGSLLSSMIIALTALSCIGAGVAQAVRQRTGGHSAEAGIHSIPVYLGGLLAVICILGMLAAPGSSALDRTIFGVPGTLIVVASFSGMIAAVAFWLRLRRIPHIGVALFFLAAITWVVPLLGELAMAIVRGQDEAEHLTWIGAASPIGALVMAWGDRSEGLADLFVGLVLQAALCLGVILFVVITTKRWQRRAANPKTLPSSNTNVAPAMAMPTVLTTDAEAVVEAAVRQK